VFEWLAAPAQPIAVQDQGSLQGRAEPAPRAPGFPMPAVRPITMSPARATDPGQPPGEPGLSASSIDVGQEEVVEHADERRPSGRAAQAPAIPASTEEGVDEILTVSIGAIHLRVEGPAPAPVVAARPANPAKRPRPERRPASRLSRHYLRP